MRNINEYLLSKKNPNAPDDSFPELPVKDPIVKFLEKMGFEKFEVNENDPWANDKFSGAMSQMKNKFYMCQRQSNGTYLIMFANPGWQSSKNPAFVMYAADTDKPELHTANGGFEVSYNTKTCPKYEQFVAMVNKFFKWA